MCALQAGGAFFDRIAQDVWETFAIVAVNGYNDDRDAVAKYTMKDRLTHPIVLQGQTVSDDLYHVGAYPTTFWVDHNGTVTGYDVGYASRKRLEDRIANMLAR